MMMTTVVSGGQAVPVTEPADPEVRERATRRTYTAQYKLRILAEYERRDGGDKGALLRREGLYSSMISEWRKQRDASIGHDMGNSRLVLSAAWVDDPRARGLARDSTFRGIKSCDPLEAGSGDGEDGHLYLRARG